MALTRGPCSAFWGEEVSLEASVSLQGKRASSYLSSNAWRGSGPQIAHLRVRAAANNFRSTRGGIKAAATRNGALQSPRPIQDASKGEPGPMELYEVRIGDSVYALCRQRGVSPQEVCHLNGWRQVPRKLLVGQTIKLPPLPQQAATETVGAGAALEASSAVGSFGSQVKESLRTQALSLKAASNSSRRISLSPLGSFMGAVPVCRSSIHGAAPPSSPLPAGIPTGSALMLAAGITTAVGWGILQSRAMKAAVVAVDDASVAGGAKASPTTSAGASLPRRAPTNVVASLAAASGASSSTPTPAQTATPTPTATPSPPPPKGLLTSSGWQLVSPFRRGGKGGGELSSPLIQREADLLNRAEKIVAENTLTRKFTQSLADRMALVGEHFPSLYSMEDFMSRVEVALFENGFVGENTIACLNVCRDEVCEPMREAVEEVFGSSFQVNGLGAMLTCGVTGVKAGISHAPTIGGRERYVFFSFPHIAIDAENKVGSIHRPGRGQESTACGALIGALAQIKASGVDPLCKTRGVHEPHDCEFSICRARMARRLKATGLDTAQVDLVTFTGIAEECITHDLEELIQATVDTSKADYAVITGVQIHSWEAEANAKDPMRAGDGDNFEFVSPRKAYCVVGGVRKEMDLSKMPGLTPRMITLMRHSNIAKEGPTGGRFPVKTAAGGTVATRVLTDKKKVMVAPGKAPPPPPTPIKLSDAPPVDEATRLRLLQEHFPYFLGYEDFVSRVEISLHKHGFESYNSIVCINLCRDEITGALKEKIDRVFGSSFNVNGLGGVLTCGVTGLKAGLSHSPTCSFTGRERYIFFSFPHIAIDSEGTVGRVCRPLRSAPSTACDSYISILEDLRTQGAMKVSSMAVGTHDGKDPEFSILKQRIGRAVVREGRREETLDLVKLTKLAERMITEDLENLILQTVDIKKSDYAVITGVQIHNWRSADSPADETSLEVVAPSSSYCVVDGVRKEIDIIRTPSLAPRQVELLGNAEQELS
eukprot:jgi/Mesvir1/21345/Mv10027-RA.2